MSFNELELQIVRWAEARKIIPNSTPATQLMKTMSELGELADATSKNNMGQVTDGVGDVLVTPIIYCALQDISIVKCLEYAYDEIKDRKGTLLPNGLFVKDEA